MNTLNKTFLPVTLDECHARGWDAPDFVYVCGDAYVDHPSFGLAIISRILEKRGLSRGNALPAAVAGYFRVQAVRQAPAWLSGDPRA